MDLYRSSTNPRIPLNSEAQIRAALDAGYLEETHYLDLKRQLNSGPKDNAELAHDLAQFAVDAGALIIGVQETPVHELKPQRLVQLPERVEQVARSKIDPPLAVIITAAPSTNDPEVGYLIVEVPASPLAPHQVEGAYMGRGDKVKYVMSDAEVRRHHEQRRPAAEVAGRLLDAMAASDPQRIDPNGQAHLFLVAQPVSPNPDRLKELTETAEPGVGVAVAVGAALNWPWLTAARRAGGLPPGIAEVQYDRATVTGLLLTSWALGPGRNEPRGSSRGRGRSVEVRTDGGIRIYDDSLTRPSQDSGLLLGEYDLLVTCHQLMALAAEVGDRSGYRGSWNLGVAASGLQGARSAIIARHYGDQGPQFDDPEYRATAEVAHADLNGKPAGLRRSTG